MILRAVFGVLFILSSLCAQEFDAAKDALLRSYPQIKEIKDNLVVFHSGTALIYDDFRDKNESELLGLASIKDMFTLPYQDGSDGGRVRNEEFFKEIYGKDRKSIENNLVIIEWFDGSKVQTTKINDIDKKLKNISSKLALLPEEVRKKATKPSGSYNFRYIRGTNRLSAHSFGIAIDLNPKYGNYWMDDMEKNGVAKCCSNPLPREIVRIFEEEGFIWGGRWRAYDTFHFEYRPELLLYTEYVMGGCA